MAGPFDDELSDDEQKLISSNDAIPPAADEDNDPGNSVDQAIADAPAPAAAEPPVADPNAAPNVDANAAAGGQNDDEELAAFLEKHKDKSPEDLARIALQQSKRANREAATNRRTSEAVAQVAARARAAAERREQLANMAPDAKARFRQEMEADPDGATQKLFDTLIDTRVQEADIQAQELEVEEAIVFAETHIPEFAAQWPGMHALANEVGFSNDELNGISDGRTLIVLSLAAHTARLMKAGVMDRFGNLGELPAAAQATPLDPRLAAPDPQRTLGGGGRGARTSQSLDQQLNALAQMSEEDFAALDPKLVEDLLRKAA